MPAQRPARGVTLAAGAFALCRDRGVTAGRRDPLVGVLGQRCGVNVDGPGNHEPVLVHELDPAVVRGTPDARVRGYGHPELARRFEGSLLWELRIAGYVEGQLKAEHLRPRHPPLGEGAEVRRVGPF